MPPESAHLSCLRPTHFMNLSAVSFGSGMPNHTLRIAYFCLTPDTLPYIKGLTNAVQQRGELVVVQFLEIPFHEVARFASEPQLLKHRTSIALL